MTARRLQIWSAEHDERGASRGGGRRRVRVLQRLYGALEMRTLIEVENAYYAHLESAHPAPAGQTIE